MSLTADLLRGYTDAILLRLLTAGESYGYEMNQELARISGGRFELKEATLYTAFRRLEESGCITARRLAQEQRAWEETRELLDLLLLDGASFADDMEEDRVIW